MDTNRLLMSTMGFQTQATTTLLDLLRFAMVVLLDLPIVAMAGQPSVWVSIHSLLLHRELFDCDYSASWSSKLGAWITHRQVSPFRFVCFDFSF